MLSHENYDHLSLHSYIYMNKISQFPTETEHSQVHSGVLDSSDGG